MGGEKDELERLREVERRLTSITTHAPDFILEFDRAGVISYMNRPAPGHTIEDMLGTNVRKWMEPEFRDAFARAVDEVFETKELASYESVGSVTGRHYINRISPVLEGDHITSVILITHDVTELKQAEDKAKQAEQRYRALVEASFEGIAISVDRVMVEGNQRVADMFGYTRDELKGKTPADMATPESQALIAKNIRAGIETPYEVTCIRKDGTTFPCELLGRNATYKGQQARVTGFRDLTERHRQERDQRRREDRVRHAQKLETLGVLAGGIAHDFNNLLTIVMANADSARSANADAQRTRQSLEQISRAVMRARELTAQLLVYAGQAEHKTEPVCLSTLVRELMELLKVSISKKADLHCRLADELPTVDADQGQLRQIVMNLIINASESLAGGRGDIEVTTGTVDADSAYLERSYAPKNAEPGTYVYIEVVDSGTGMDATTLTRVFDPFFTTKPAGRGLGLASVLGIVHTHRGAIDVESRPEAGTRFRVLLPASAARAAATDVPAERVAAAADVIGGTILVAEDESAIASVVELTLQDEGYRVLLAQDGERAASLFHDHADEIDLVLLDLTMPKLNGLEVLAEIRRIHRDVPVILSSGYSARSYQDTLAADAKASFLAKPYPLDALIDAVGAAVRGRGQ